MESLPVTIAVLLLCSSFIRIFVSLNILRFGIGLNGAGFGAVISVMALSIVLLTSNSSDAFLSARTETLEQALSQHRDSIDKGIDPSVRSYVKSLVKDDPNPSGMAITDRILIAANVLTQLRDGCTIGLTMLIPFLLIDLLVVNLLMVLNITQISAVLVSLPIKLGLFLAVDGWSVIIQRLIG